MGTALAQGGVVRAGAASRHRKGHRQITIADICLASQVAGAKFFKVDLAPYPTVARIAATCAKNDAFARAHPLKQPGAPAA
jgi:maleylacetoacetate isomerase